MKSKEAYKNTMFSKTTRENGGKEQGRDRNRERDERGDVSVLEQSTFQTHFPRKITVFTFF